MTTAPMTIRDLGHSIDARVSLRTESELNHYLYFSFAVTEYR